MFQSSVSGLQRLFSTASTSLSPHTQRGQRRLESVTEEAHTYDLLYPESDALWQGQHHAYPLRHGDPASIAAAASSTDDRGGLDIQSPRDVRIVVAQDATARSPQPRILYDSHPSVPLVSARNGLPHEWERDGHQRAESFIGGLTGGGMRRNVSERKPNTAPHTRHPSLSQTSNSTLTSPASPLYPVSELGGLFTSSQGSNTSARPATSDGETFQGKVARESREETDALLECMFGSVTGFPSTSSTKIHIRPPNMTDGTNERRPISATRESTSAPFQKRRTPLTRSTTAADLQAFSIDVSQQKTRQSSPAIWITRLFFVEPKDPGFTDQSSADQLPPEHNQPHRPPDSPTDTSNLPPGKKKVKQLKTPTYAIAILLQMPAHRQRPLTPSMSRSLGHTASSPKSWPFDGSLSFEMPGMDMNTDIEYVISQWSVIDRALSTLEIVARCKISDALGRLEIPHMPVSTRDPVSTTQSISGMPPKKKKQPTQWTLQLSSGALQESSLIHDVVEATGKRIALALKIRRVLVGQGRWGIWREEARWVDKWVGGREQNFFFFNLLTAFVGSHTEWLDSLAPKGYRRRHEKRLEKTHKETNAIRHRTVIICSDKMAARRLIFLLSAFLPGVHATLFPESRPYLESSWSMAPKSQSPRSGVPIAKEKSSQRTIDHNPKGNFNNSIPFHARTVSFSGPHVMSSEDTPPENQGQDSLQQPRRASDARSIPSAALLISSACSVTRKSSTTTTATIKPESSVPVAHFAAHPSDEPVQDAVGPRRTSSESLAPLSLQRTLSRSESNEPGTVSSDSQSRSGWGSLISFWSGKRGSSTDNSDPLASSEEGLGISGVSKDVRVQRSAPKLSQMVDEVTNGKMQPATRDYTKINRDPIPEGRSLLQETGGTNSTPEDVSLPKQISTSISSESFPLKLSIDENDGVVDVDLPPINSYSSSFGSFTSSPIRVPTAASSFNDHSAYHGRTPNPAAQPSSPELPGDVAGWLRYYHEDFTLQAVRPYHRLIDDVKQSMRTQPTPNLTTEDCDRDGWTEICSVIIADTAKFSLTRLRLRRKDASSPHHRADALLECSDLDISNEEQIIEEPLMDMDPTFIDAVEKVVSLSGDSSRVASQNPSRAPSPTRHQNRTPTEGSSAGLEIPRSRCRSMVLGALEQVARSVSDEIAAKEQKGKDVAGTRKRNDVPAESTLREGVKKWFCEVNGQSL